MSVTKLQLEAVSVIAAIIVIAVLITYALDQSVPNQLSRIPDETAYEQGMEINSWVDLAMKIIIAVAVIVIIGLELFEHITISGYFRKKKVRE
ncbi:MAG: hypothetical protein K0A89_05685 [ANME-2 cluster archaeon]|nr:hypothetical protein [ANME-2 cluster archaeon]